VPLRFIQLLFELGYLFGQMCYLIGISTSWFVPGFFCGVEGFRQPVLSAAVLIEPTTLCGVVGHERFANSLAPCAKLAGTSLLGYSLTCRFGSRCGLGHVGSGCCFLSVYSTQVGGVTRCDKMILKMSA